MAAIPFPTLSGARSPAVPFAGDRRSDAADLAGAGADGAPLSTEQKRRLAQAAARACALQRSLGLWSDADGDADAFRHAAAFDACGVSSFRAMGQRHYLAVLAHYRRLAGDESAAQAAAARIAGDPARRALAVLRRACAEVAEPFGGASAAMEYANRCSWAINKVGLDQASPRGIYRAMFTLRRRAEQLLRRQRTAISLVSSDRSDRSDPSDLPRSAP